jgi:hypothetical protein
MTPPEEDRRTSAVRLTLLIQAALGVGLAVFLWRGDWENVFLTALVVGLTMLPALLARRHRVFIPPDFQLVSALFVFLSLFLGSAVDFYYRYWWWDMVLHAGSGFLFGVVGFLAVFLLNQTERIPREMRPAFVCLFAVTFSVSAGVVWEIFEYVMDLIAPSLNMQSGETGVHDTMKDLIVDVLGALVVAAMGWGYMKSGRYSFIADAVRGFIRRNPRLFVRRGEGRAGRR